MTANNSTSCKGNSYYYWVSFHHFRWNMFDKDDGTDGTLDEEVFPYTTYAEFVCYKDETYTLSLKFDLVVQGIIQTYVENLKHGCNLYRHITLCGKKWCTIEPLAPSKLYHKRLFLHYASVMYPNAYLCTSIGGGLPLKTIVQDKQKAIADYLAVNKYALDEDEHRLSHSLPPEYFDWYRHCKYVSELEFEKNEEKDLHVIKALEMECHWYTKYNTTSIESKAEAIFSFLLDEYYKSKLYFRKQFIKKRNRLGPPPAGEGIEEELKFENEYYEFEPGDFETENAGDFEPEIASRASTSSGEDDTKAGEGTEEEPRFKSVDGFENGDITPAKASRRWNDTDNPSKEEDDYREVKKKQRVTLVIVKNL